MRSKLALAVLAVILLVVAVAMASGTRSSFVAAGGGFRGHGASGSW